MATTPIQTRYLSSTAVSAPSSAVVLTSGSGQVQAMTPSAAINVTLPTTKILNGRAFTISNLSTNHNITLLSNSGGTVLTVYPGTSATVVAAIDSANLPTDWISVIPSVVVPGTSSGLVSASGLTGNTTGSAIAAGFVGETNFVALNTPASTSVATTFVDAGPTMTLSPGLWIITCNIVCGSAFVSGTASFQIALRSGTSTNVITANWSPFTASGAASAVSTPILLSIPVTVTTSTTYKLSIQSNVGSSTNIGTLYANGGAGPAGFTSTSYFYATRIA